MTPVIDAHAHLIPFHAPGSRDARTGTAYLSGGRVRKADGETVPLMPASYGERGFPAGALLEAMDGVGSPGRCFWPIPSPTRRTTPVPCGTGPAASWGP